MKSLMTINGLGANFNMPPALKTIKNASTGDEETQGLPPYKVVTPYVVDEYPACPTDWMNGSDIAASYFVPIKLGRGMWLDFNECENHTHDVAVVLSIQGINPINGQKQDKMQLEQYKGLKKCPVHNVDFKQDRFCPKCDFKWPAQNYLATTGTPKGTFWLDGFRSEDGKVRQYILTEDKVRGIASQLIGEDRVFAIGIAFFLSKKPKPVKTYTPNWRGGIYQETTDYNDLLIGGSTPYKFLKSYEKLDKWQTGDQTKACSNDYLDSPKVTCSTDAQMGGGALRSMNVNSLAPMGFTAQENTKGSIYDSNDDVDCLIGASVAAGMDTGAIQSIKTTKVEIGAGAVIKQQVYDDPQNQSYWEEEPAAFIYLNYAIEEECERILKAGKRPQSFLGKLKVGN